MERPYKVCYTKLTSFIYMFINQQIKDELKHELKVIPQVNF